MTAIERDPLSETADELRHALMRAHRWDRDAVEILYRSMLNNPIRIRGSDFGLSELLSAERIAEWPRPQVAWGLPSEVDLTCARPIRRPKFRVRKRRR